MTNYLMTNNNQHTLKMKKHNYILFILFLLAILTTCKKTPEIPSGNKIEIGATTIDSIGYYGLKLSTIVSGLQGNEVEQLGYCWSFDKEPTLDDNITVGNYDTNGISATLLDLTANQQYKIRPFISTAHHTFFGNVLNTSTLQTGKPIVITNDISDITANSAVCGGVNDDGGLSIISRGVCWNSTGNPTMEDNIGITLEEDGNGKFTSNIVSLSEGMSYYVVAYASNDNGISYGDLKSFSTLFLALPEVTTLEPTDITSNSATCGGEVISNGNGTALM